MRPNDCVPHCELPELPDLTPWKSVLHTTPAMSSELKQNMWEKVREVKSEEGEQSKVEKGLSFSPSHSLGRLRAADHLQGREGAAVAPP